MRFAAISTGLTVWLSACATTPNTIPLTPAKSSPMTITQAEAAKHACPPHIIQAGASEADCECAQTALLTLGQDKTNLAQYEPPSDEGNAQSRRDILIGIIRLDAYEICGFFKDGHPVNENLGAGGL